MKTYYQAFPLGRDTFKGIASSQARGGYTILHATAAGSVTVSFDGGATSLAVDVTAGQDFALAENVETITSTAEILMS